MPEQQLQVVYMYMPNTHKAKIKMLMKHGTGSV